MHNVHMVCFCFKTERRDKRLIFYLEEKSAAKGNEFAKMIIQTAVNREEARLRKQNNRENSAVSAHSKLWITF
ncbi:MAG: hypothetical protein ACLVAU_13255 [Ruminococcus sp.]